MKIHAIQTGTVALTVNWREGVGRGRWRLVRTLLDRRWTSPLPIYAFVIEHPEGVIVVDTGESARVSEPGYFPRWQPFFRFAVRERVRPDQEIGAQLTRLGIPASDIRCVVLTHLHTDHAGGLHDFPSQEILVTRSELEYASGLLGRLRGYPNKNWPAWFSPTVIELEPIPFGPFPASMTLTKAGDVTLVPVPGHSPGQLAVVVDEGDHSVFLAADSSYTEDLLLRGVADGVGPDDEAQRLTHERIRTYAAETPAVYLPTHDPETAVRLSERRPVHAASERRAA
jgi:N-acyl homoserine lactone hydrolase